MDERLKKEVLDANVVRGMFSSSDHFAVLAKELEQSGSLGETGKEK